MTEWSKNSAFSQSDEIKKYYEGLREDIQRRAREQIKDDKAIDDRLRKLERKIDALYESDPED